MPTYPEITPPLAANGVKVFDPHDSGVLSWDFAATVAVVVNTDAAGGSVLLEHTDNAGGPWQPLASAALTADTTGATVLTAPVVRRFYRVTVRAGATPQTRLDVRSSVRPLA